MKTLNSSKIAPFSFPPVDAIEIDADRQTDRQTDRRRDGNDDVGRVFLVELSLRRRRRSTV